MRSGIVVGGSHSCGHQSSSSAGGYRQRGGQDALFGVVGKGVREVVSLVEVGLLARASSLRLVVMRSRLVDWDGRAVDCIQQDVSVVWSGDRARDVRLHIGGQRLQMKRTGGHLLMMMVIVVEGFGGRVQIDRRETARCSG